MTGLSLPEPFDVVSAASLRGFFSKSGTDGIPLVYRSALRFFEEQ